MQSYTHVAISAIIARLIYQENILCQISLVAGAVVVDIPWNAQWVLDKIKKRPPFMENNKVLKKLADAFHSLLLLPILIFFYIPFFIGAYTHVLVDIISHKDEKKAGEYPGWLYPLPYKLRIGLFDYAEVPFRLFGRLDVAITELCFFIWIGTF
ncbi:MAG: hypothetical protein ABIC36_01210 [bacterium]